MEPTINKSLCIACGACESLAPSVFEVGAEGVAEVIGPVTDFNKGNVIEAAEACPTQAIAYEDYQNLKY